MADASLLSREQFLAKWTQDHSCACKPYRQVRLSETGVLKFLYILNFLIGLSKAGLFLIKRSVAQYFMLTAYGFYALGHQRIFLSLLFSACAKLS